MNTEGRVAYSKLELMQVLLPDMLPNKTITLNLSKKKKKIFKMKNGSLSEVCLLAGRLMVSAS